MLATAFATSFDWLHVFTVRLAYRKRFAIDYAALQWTIKRSNISSGL
jgi:hypothetical protein